MTLNHTTITYLMSDALQTELQKKKKKNSLKRNRSVINYPITITAILERI